MVATTEQVTEMKVHSVEIVPNTDNTAYVFSAKGKEIQFIALRPELDVRGGFDSRDTSYLLDQGIVREDADGHKIVDIVVPWEVFSKRDADEYSQGKYELLQGNTRYKFVLECIEQNLSLYQAAKEIATPEAMAQYEQDRFYFAPINFTILPQEIDPSDVDSHEYIFWRQQTVNNAVKPHSTLQLAFLGLQYLQDRFAKNSQLPKEERRSKDDIRSDVAKTFKVSVPRTYHWEKLALLDSVPEILNALDEQVLIFDVVVRMISAVNTITKQYRDANPTLKPEAIEANGINLKQFFNDCLQHARTEAASKNELTVKIYESTVDAVRKNWTELYLAKPETQTDDNPGDSTDTTDAKGEQQGEGEGNGDKDDRYAKADGDELRAMIEDALEFFLEFGVTDASGKLVYTDDQLRKIAKSVENTRNTVSKLPTIAELEAKRNAEEAEKLAKKEADKAAKEEAKIQAQLAKAEADYNKAAEAGNDLGKSHSEPTTVS